MKYILCYCSTLKFFLQAQSSVPCNGGHVCSINNGFTYHNIKYGHISDAVFYIYQWFPTVSHSLYYSNILYCPEGMNLTFKAMVTLYA
jgi:hypothetical protein